MERKIENREAPISSDGGRLGKGSARVLSSVARRIKGSDYRVDSRIGIAYQVRVASSRVGMKVRGSLRFPGRDARPFLGVGAAIVNGNSLQFGPGVTFGPDSYVDALSENGVRLGRNCSVGRNTRIECTGNIQQIGVGMTVGDDVGLGTDCFYGAAGGIEIGSDTIVGNFVSFHSENHVSESTDVPIRLQGVTRKGIVVGRDCWIGAKSTILDGARIGDGCIIAAGSVVTAGDYASRGIYGGVPAKEIGKRS